MLLYGMRTSGPRTRGTESRRSHRGKSPRHDADIRSDVVVPLARRTMQIPCRIAARSLALLEAVASACRADRDHAASVLDGLAEIQRGVIELIRRHETSPMNRNGLYIR